MTGKGSQGAAGRRAGVLTAVLLPVGLGLVCMLAPRAAHAQAQQVVDITYLAAGSGTPPGNPEVVTQSIPIDNGVGHADINSAYIGGPITLTDGNKFVVQPVVDPFVTIVDSFTNLSGASITDVAFVLTNGLYFTQSDLNSGGFGSTQFGLTPQLADPFTFFDPNDTNNPDNGLTVYASVIFSQTPFDTPILNGQTASLKYTFHTPTILDTPTPPNYYIATVTNINGGDPLQMAVAPEPGSLVLMAAGGGALLLLGVAAGAFRLRVAAANA